MVDTKWLDINKGDDKHPVIRSRLVAREYKHKGGIGDSTELFAGTPPLEGLRIIISQAASGKPRDQIVMTNDVSRAFFEATTTRKVCIEIPEEDLKDEEERRTYVARLDKCLYGTRDAAARFQEVVAQTMEELGFVRGKASSNI